MKWTETELQLTITLIQKGLPYNEIGKIIGRKANAIRVKAGKLGVVTTDYRIKPNEVIKKCLECNKDIESKLNKFCSHSCSATHTNKIRGFNSRERRRTDCVICTKPCFKYNKCCSRECYKLFNLNKINEKIKNGKPVSFCTIRKHFILKHGAKCMKCNWSEVHPITGLVPIHVDHIDGNSENNSENNLQIVCPNCHSLTPTFGVLNKGNGRRLRRIKRSLGLID